MQLYLIALLAILNGAHVQGQIFSNPCYNAPCRNGGTCTVLSSTQYSCSCPLGYLGTNCQTYSTACDTNPCGVGGLCNFRNDGSAVCFCLCKLESPSFVKHWQTQKLILFIFLLFFQLDTREPIVKQVNSIFFYW